MRTEYHSPNTSIDTAANLISRTALKTEIVSPQAGIKVYAQKYQMGLNKPENVDTGRKLKKNKLISNDIRSLLRQDGLKTARASSTGHSFIVERNPILDTKSSRLSPVRNASFNGGIIRTARRNASTATLHQNDYITPAKKINFTNSLY